MRGAAGARGVAPPRLRTARLLLREFRSEDVAPHAQAARDEEAQRFLGGVKSGFDSFMNLAGHAGHWSLRGFGGWIVSRADDESYLGRLGLFEPDGWPGTELGYKLAPWAWGHGYATEAAHAVLGYAWTALGRDELISLIDPGNDGSARVAQRLGAENTGRIDTPFGPADRWLHRAPADRWSLRAATADDAPRIAAALAEAVASWRAISPPGWTPVRTQPAHAAAQVRTAVAMPGGVLAGHVSWSEDGALTLLVDPGWRGSGLARRLLDAVPAESLRTTVPAADGRARRFFTGAGFAETGAAEVAGLPGVTYARVSASGL